MVLQDPILAGLFILAAFSVLLLVMVVLTKWARRRGKGAMAVGAFLSVLAPDPTFEQKVRLVEEAQEVQSEDDREGEAK
jgi:hypothetical protein